MLNECWEIKNLEKVGFSVSSRSRISQSSNASISTYILLWRRLVKQKIHSVSSCYTILIFACIFHTPSAEISLLHPLIVDDSLLFLTGCRLRLSFLTSTYGSTFHCCFLRRGEENITQLFTLRYRLPLSPPHLHSFSNKPTPSRRIMTPNKNLIFSWWIYSWLSLDREIYSVFTY